MPRLRRTLTSSGLCGTATSVSPSWLTNLAVGTTVVTLEGLRNFKMRARLSFLISMAYLP